MKDEFEWSALRRGTLGWNWCDSKQTLSAHCVPLALCLLASQGQRCCVSFFSGWWGSLWPVAEACVALKSTEPRGGVNIVDRKTSERLCFVGQWVDLMARTGVLDHPSSKGRLEGECLGLSVAITEYLRRVIYKP